MIEVTIGHESSTTRVTVAERHVGPRPRRLALAAVLGAGWLAATAPAAVKPAGLPDPRSQFNRAVKLVHRADRPDFTHAYVLEVDGVTGSHGATRASGIVSWTFAFGGASAHSRYSSATLAYGRHGFGHVVGHPLPVLEDVAIRRPPKMTLASAVTLLHRHGHRRPFFSVVLRDPLGPKPGHPLYIFGFDGNRYVAVDTVTGKVASIQ